MGNSAVQFKIMPTSPDVDFESLKGSIKEKIEADGGVIGEFSEEPIAFGLKALIVAFAYPEEKEIDELGNQFNELEGISSSEMIDYRRAIG